VNIFVETNFVLEAALEQQEAQSCEVLIELAAAGRIRLLVPAYSFVEPHETFTRRHAEREALRSRMSNELGQLARSAPLTERVTASQDIVKLLVDSTEFESNRLDEVKQRLWTIAEVLPRDLVVLRSAADCQNSFDLSAQDAVVYASIRARLEADHAAESCFISRNPRDFDDPDLRRDLATFDCKYFASFATAAQYITHKLNRTPSA
jgi:predicted nucleic acid-binding protein